MKKKLLLVVLGLFSLHALALEQVVQVQGLDCEKCIQSIESSLKKNQQVKKVSVDLATGKVVVQSEKELSPETIEKLINEAGFKLKK